METSPVNHRLPEADSLPDGFVESEEMRHDGSSLIVDGGLDHNLSIISTDNNTDSSPKHLSTTSQSSGEEDYKKLYSATSQDGVFIAPPTESHTSSVPGPDTEVCMGSHTPDVKESSTAEHTDCSGNKKLESIEGKRKVGKHNIKAEKELLQFTLNYQKVIEERDKAVAARERLESLCRELQRQNKMLLDECQRVSTEGQNMRSELSTKFSDAIKDVGIKLEEQKDECLAQLKENDMLRNKLKHLGDQYAICEEQFTQKLKQKMLELEIANLKIQQHQERSAQEQTQRQLYVEQVTQLLATEKNLRSQLAADGEKFQQFQDALLKSNEVFETFKQEMEKMAKLIKELKKENEFLKSKCEKSDIALVKLVEERELMKKQIEKVKNQKEKLESLCRSLQAERKQNSVGRTTGNLAAEQVKVSSADEPGS